MHTTKPEATEFAPYYDKYTSRVPDGDIITILRDQLAETTALLRSIPEEQGEMRYAEGKWTIKELIGHIIDGERVFAYRALRFARGDATPLPGFDQDVFMSSAPFANVTLAELTAELTSVRESTIFLFAHLDDEAWSRRGVASDNEVTVRALAHMIAGHELHHRAILQSHYLSAVN
ncbi:MAG TPA: DinB family protein [Pyrinomonadaceae bacterium]|nr:DinB family protein [Pyrinomonadaceae bacterium]